MFVMKLCSFFSFGIFKLLALLVFCFGFDLLGVAQVVGRFEENFDNPPWVGISINSTSTNIGTIHKNWTRNSSDPTNFIWAVYTDHTASTINTGPRGGNTNFTGNYFGLKTRPGTSGSRTSTLISPTTDMSTVNHPYFQFYYHINGACVPDLMVEINDGSGWQQIFQSSTATQDVQTDLYKRFKLDLSNYADTVTVRFTGSTSGNCDGIIAIDNVSFGAIICDVVENLSQTILPDYSIKVNWDPVPGSQGYGIYLVKNGVWEGVPSSSIIPDTASSNFYFLPKKFIGDNYKLYVKNLCPNIFNQPHIGPLELKPPYCLPLSPPYFNRLDQWPAQCWNENESLGFDSNGSLKTKDGKSYAHLYPSSSGSGSSTLYSPLFAMDNRTNELGFIWSRRQSSNNSDSLFVFAKEYGTSTWSQIHLITGPNFYDPSITSASKSDGIKTSIPLDSNLYGGKIMEFKLVYQFLNNNSPDFNFINFSIAPKLTADLELISAQAHIAYSCVGLYDSISLQIVNKSNSLVDFQNSPTNVNYIISNGNTLERGFKTLNSGQIAFGDTLSISVNNIKINQMGNNYIPKISLELSNSNQSSFNDTLAVQDSHLKFNSSPFSVSPEFAVVINNTNTPVNIQAKSPIFTNGDFIITEICHNKSNIGAPVGGWPSYLTANKYIEISGIPNADLFGYTLQIWHSTLNFTHQFANNSVLGPNGTAILGFEDNGVSSPNDFYYVNPIQHNALSTSERGYSLWDPNGNIVDAVGYSSPTVVYQFPTGPGFHYTDWHGQIPSAQVSAGIRLEGLDLDNGTNWVLSANSSQTPNVLNPGVDTNGIAVPFGTFNWEYRGTTLGSSIDTNVGPFNNTGLHEYIGIYNSNCGVFRDTVVIFVNLPNTNCSLPGQASFSDIGCDDALINWTNPGGQTLVSYGKAGTVPGQGMVTISTTDSLRIQNLKIGGDYDIWLRNICTTDSSAWTGPYSLNLIQAPIPVAKFSMTQSKIGNQAVLILNGTKSQNGDLFLWELGNGQKGQGIIDTIPLPFNGDWDIKLIVKNSCGLDSISKKTFFNIGLEETYNSKYNLSIFPNPTEGILNLEVQAEQKGKMELLLLDSHGKLMLRDDLEMQEGLNAFVYDLNGFSAGLYFLVLRNENGVWKRKVLVR